MAYTPEYTPVVMGAYLGNFLQGIQLCNLLNREATRTWGCQKTGPTNDVLPVVAVLLCLFALV